MSLYVMGDWDEKTIEGINILSKINDKENTPTTIFQVGDFRVNQNNIALAEEELSKCQNISKIVIIKGNHDDHKILKTVSEQRLVDDQGFFFLGDKVRYAANAFYEDMNLLVVGGATSVSRNMPMKNISWWDNDGITDVPYVDATNVDIMLSHEAPVSWAQNQQVFTSYPQEILNQAIRDQTIIETLIKKNAPKIAFHGHWHIFSQYLIGNTRMVSLAKAGSYGSAVKITGGSLSAIFDGENFIEMPIR